MAKKTIQVKMPFILSSLFFLLLGGFVSYLLINTTNILPINYEKRVQGIYDNQKRERGWETYIDLVNGYLFNYPENYNADIGFYNSMTKKGVQLKSDPTENRLYDKTINIGILTLKKNQTLLDFAKSRYSYYSYGSSQNKSKYQETILNNQNIVVEEFEMTEDFHKELEKQNYWGKLKIEPIGYKTKTIYIKRGNSVYIFESGSLYEETQREIFDKIANSLKFIY